MLSTGDVQGSLRKLETLLRVIKYQGDVDYNCLSKGDPSAFLPIVSYTLTSFSPCFAEQLIANGFDLIGKTDLRFTDTLYKVLRDIFNYKPILNKQQFLQWGFSQRKLTVTCDIINLVLQKHNQLKKASGKPSAMSRKDHPSTGHTKAPRVKFAPTVVEVEEDEEKTLHAYDRPFVVNHIENHPICPANILHSQAFSSYSAGNELCEPSGEEDKENQLHVSINQSSEIEGRLSALEARLESLSGLHRLSVLEKRLEELERQRKVDKDEGEFITVPREDWENLMSRVLLLETKIELSNTKSDAPQQCPCSAASDCTASVYSKEDLKHSLDRITNMLKNTSSLLKTTGPPTTPCK